MSRPIRAGRLRGPRPTGTTNVVPIESLRAGGAPVGSGGPRPPAGGGDLQAPRPMAGAAIILRALWPVLVALARVAWAAVAAVSRWVAVAAAYAALSPFILAWVLLRVVWATLWVWLVLLLLLVLL